MLHSCFSRRVLPLYTFAALLVLSQASLPIARAAEVVVKNDSLTDGGTAAIQAGFVAGESAAAWLTSPCNGNIVAVQVFWRSLSGTSGQSIEDSISIYPGGTFPNPSGTPVVLEAPVMQDNVLNEFRYLDENSTIPISIPVTQGQVFVVTFKFENSPNQSTGPSVVTDTNGCQNGKNGIFAIPPGSWFNGCFFGISGDFVIRAVVNCPTLGGACCFPNGTCSSLLQASCDQQGGNFNGDGTSCSPNPCPQPVGACCRLDGSCQNNILENNCQGEGESFSLGATCAQVTCEQPTGRCCMPSGTACLLKTQAECTTAGGIFGGPLTTCSGTPCSGACCNPGNNFCSVQTLASCNSLNGRFQGFGIACNGNVCPTGACCMPNGSCTVITPFSCNGAGGVMHIGQTCAQANCPQPTGACCVSDGSCTIAEQVPCEGFGNTWLGMGTNCDSNPCSGCSGPADGDMNGDLHVNGADIPVFTNALINGGSSNEVCHGNFSGANSLDNADIPGMVSALLAGS